MRINLNVVLLFFAFGCPDLFGDERMFVEIVFIGDRCVVAFFFLFGIHVLII